MKTFVYRDRQGKYFMRILYAVDAKNERLISARTKSKRLETFGTCFCSSEDCVRLSPQLYLGGGFKYFLFSALPGKMIQFD